MPNAEIETWVWSCNNESHFSNHSAASIFIEMEYLWSDAWLLQSIVLASGAGGATLSQVIAAADVVNHALPTDDELHGALVRLTTAGLVEEIDARFAPTALVPANVVATIRTSGWQRGRRRASDFLHAEEWTTEKNVRDPRNGVQYEGLTSKRIRRAELEYRRKLKRERGRSD